VGESAAATIELPAAVLRSTAVTILGTAGVPSREILMNAIEAVWQRGARGELRIETERVPLEEIERAWGRRTTSGTRLVVVP
jgi:hypothetical protein